MSYSSLFDLPADQRAMIDGELQPGESITWFGQPQPRLFTIQTIPMMLFAIPWTAFAIFWTVMASGARHGHLAKGPGITFALFGVPFILIGLGMLSSPLWMRRASRRTYYVITNRRAIIFQRGFGVTTQSYTPDQLRILTKRQRADGSGDIVFQGAFASVVPGQVTTQVGQAMRCGFFSIPDVKEVESLLLKLAGPASQPIRSA